MRIVTERLLIRAFELSDAKDILKVYSSPELQKYIDGKALSIMEDAENLIKRYQGPHPFDNKLGVYAVVERSSNKVIGTALIVPLRDSEGNFLDEVEVGYHINKEYWNRGYATEVSKGLIKYGFDEVGLSEIFALVLPENASSIRVLEKSGMYCEGETSEYYGEELLKYKAVPFSLNARIKSFEKHGIGLKRDNIVILKEHNPNWKQLFQAESHVLRQSLNMKSLRLHHCGSTSISHICAKPIIDILGEVDDINDLDEKQVVLEKLGYEYKGEYGLHGRRYCVLYNPEKTHGFVHLHVYQCGHPSIYEHLYFCRYLEENLEDALEYQELKKNLQSLPRKDYSPAKTEFVTNILRKMNQENIK